MHFERSEPEVISPRAFSNYSIFPLVKYLTKSRFDNLWAKTSRTIATEYCERDLSFQTDGYKAFAGVEAQLCSTFSVFSIWGIYLCSTRRAIHWWNRRNVYNTLPEPPLVPSQGCHLSWLSLSSVFGFRGLRYARTEWWSFQLDTIMVFRRLER